MRHSFTAFRLIITLLLFSCSSNKISVTLNNGLNNIRPGMQITQFEGLLGKAEEITESKLTENQRYHNYFKKGISLLEKQDTVKTIFYFLISKKYEPFKGEMEFKINEKSTIAFVKKQLGEPDRESKTKVSQFGEFPGSIEIYLSYPKVGIAFSFLDEKLANIRQFNVK